ncbi:conserved hypothetical protein [Psychromonas ingrahamii 37]|uniref:DUF2860 domain-containing protein n=1 Tax=Psychromonas ingrahamii (strain DSM 17664 / CCUG 51855 / 37) TaxID=357804 RepID=A1T0H5_PSYIN|nr:DUF2860 domain-containing protein [Psychromonas ingrahamii]ABM05240.1 conserved hypothetical protein [Psychromonas ingrahamii 37]
MRKLLPVVISSILLSNFLAAEVAANSAPAVQPLAEKAGWEFTLGINLGYSAGRSQLNTNNDNAVNENLNNNGQAISKPFIFPTARAQYTFTELKTQIFAGDSREKISTAKFQYELGITHLFNNSSEMTVAYFPQMLSFNDAWQDPYLTGSTRTTTDENAQGGRFALTRIAGSTITLKYAFAFTAIENEHSGQSLGLNAKQLTMLQRDSLYQRAEIETMYSIAPGIFFKPALQYTTRSADGEAHNFDQYGLQLSLLVFKGRHSLITTLNTGIKKFAVENPAFNEKQNTVNAGLFSVYSYDQALNWQPLSFNLLAGYTKEDSDINFYDSEGFFTSTGITYQF